MNNSLVMSAKNRGVGIQIWKIAILKIIHANGFTLLLIMIIIRKIIFLIAK